MVFVDNLDKLDKCPNCGNKLDCWYNINTQKKSRYCPYCETEYFQKELDLTILHVDPVDESEETSEILDMLIDLERDIDMLSRYARTNDDLVLVEKIQDILMKMLKVMREMK